MHALCIQMVLLRFVWWNFFRSISYITTADVKQRSQHEVCFVTVSNRFKWYSKFLIVVNHPNVLKVSPWVFKRIRSQFYHLEVLPGVEEVAFERHSHGCLFFKEFAQTTFGGHESETFYTSISWLLRNKVNFGNISFNSTNGSFKTTLFISIWYDGAAFQPNWQSHKWYVCSLFFSSACSGWSSHRLCGTSFSRSPWNSHGKKPWFLGFDVIIYKASPLFLWGWNTDKWTI